MNKAGTIILVAGFGSRLMPLTKNKPKCLVKYHGKPIIDYAMQALYYNGLYKGWINNLAIVGGYKYDVLEDYIKKQSNIMMKLSYITTNSL